MIPKMAVKIKETRNKKGKNRVVVASRKRNSEEMRKSQPMKKPERDVVSRNFLNHFSEMSAVYDVR